MRGISISLDFLVPDELFIICPHCESGVVAKLKTVDQAPRFGIYYNFEGYCGGCSLSIPFSPKQESLEAGFGTEEKPIILRG